MSNHHTTFITAVQTFYDHSGRTHLPWRHTHDPYRITVSEIMLQQTQVDRVIPKYRAFIRQFPSTKRLATAPLAEVLVAWQGLGYNRRAKLLHQCAGVVHHNRAGRWPRSYDTLLALPGIGPYTAGAITAFAYNQAVPLIETNVRTVYLHDWFSNSTDVSDQEILAVVSTHLQLLPQLGIDARTWYAALMDYGSHIKKTHGNPNSRSTSYSRQAAFRGSDREVRGAIIRALANAPATRTSLQQQLAHVHEIKFDVQLERLLAEELIQKTKQTYHLPQ